jgi:hypothetical protein
MNEDFETMSYDRFAHLVDTIRHCNIEVESDNCIIDKLNCVTRSVKIMSLITDDFNDSCRNFERWLNKKPCCFKHPVTKREIPVDVPDDTEAIYYFLRYCMKINRAGWVDDDLQAYVAYLFCKSANEE